MFGMFEHVSGRNRPFIIEQVSPPNDQKRPSKLTRLACINCRISKVTIFIRGLVTLKNNPLMANHFQVEMQRRVRRMSTV